MADPLAVARAVVAEPRRLSTTATLDLVAVCRALAEAELRPQISDELAAAVRALIDAEAIHTLAKGPEGHAPLNVTIAREQAFLTFKRIFQEEFPNV